MKKFKQLIAWLLRFFDLSCEDDRIDYLCGGEALPAPLTPEEEQAVVKRLNDGDVNAKNELIERNLRLVVLLYFSICSLRYSGVQSFGTL